MVSLADEVTDRISVFQLIVGNFSSDSHIHQRCARLCFRVLQLCCNVVQRTRSSWKWGD